MNLFTLAERDTEETQRTTPDPHMWTLHSAFPLMFTIISTPEKQYFYNIFLHLFIKTHYFSCSAIMVWPGREESPDGPSYFVFWTVLKMTQRPSRANVHHCLSLFFIMYSHLPLIWQFANLHTNTLFLPLSCSLLGWEGRSRADSSKPWKLTCQWQIQAVAVALAGTHRRR